MRWALLMDDIRMTRSLLEQGYGHDDCNGQVISYVYDAVPTRSRTSQISSWVGCGAARIARLVNGSGQGSRDS